MAGRIAAIADVYDALISDRPYKKGWEKSDAINYMKDNSGKHFDPDLIEVFMKLIDKIEALREKFSD